MTTPVQKTVPNHSINMTESNSSATYRHEFTVPESAVDQNGHVNNVVYVQWMQDVAVLHSDAVGGTRAASH